MYKKYLDGSPNIADVTKSMFKTGLYSIKPAFHRDVESFEDETPERFWLISRNPDSNQFAPGRFMISYASQDRSKFTWADRIVTHPVGETKYKDWYSSGVAFVDPPGLGVDDYTIWSKYNTKQFTRLIGALSVFACGIHAVKNYLRKRHYGDTDYVVFLYGAFHYQITWKPIPDFMHNLTHSKANDVYSL